MRKYLISVLIGIIIILLAVALIKGIKIGNFQIKSISMIKEDSENLEQEIEQINQKQSVTYKSLNDEVEAKANELKKQKENYADLILYNSEDETSGLNLYEKYEIEYLWTKLGNYATDNSLTMKLEVTNSATGAEKSYNLNFTLNGEYVSIIDCISQIEDDSTLGFKIENFKMVQADDGTIQATFTVKNVTIDNIDTTTVQDENQNTNNTNTTNNTTNNTINNTSSNTNNTL